MTVRLTQPPPDPNRSPQDTAWLEQLGRIVGALVSSGTTANRPTALLYEGRPFWDTDLDRPIFRNAANTEWIVGATFSSGTTAQRPTTLLHVGRFYFDTTLGKPIFIKSLGPTVWVDGVGTVS